MSNPIGIHHYPTVENELYLSGTVDLYYGFNAYHKARASWLDGDEAQLKEMDAHFNRVQYVIYKEDGDPSEIILLEDGLKLDWNTEFKKGLDHIVVRHKWPAPHTLETAYRFSFKELEPIGSVRWIAPDLFYWDAKP